MFLREFRSGRRCVLELVFLAVLGTLWASCNIAVHGTRDVIRTHLSHRDERRIVFEPEPAIPPEIERGETLSVMVMPTFSSGETCRFCKVRWMTDRDDVATVYEPNPPCAAGRCIILEGIGPGKAVLSLEVCPSEFANCQQRQVEVTVVR